MTKFINKESCFIGENVKIGNNVTIYENNHIEGDTTIGDNTTLLPGNFISSCKIGKSCKVLSSVLEDSEILDDVSIGPFARLRPHTLIKNGCKIGNFVEIKNSSIGNGCKISHLAYVGDVDMGAFLQTTTANKKIERLSEGMFLLAQTAILLRLSQLKMIVIFAQAPQSLKRSKSTIWSLVARVSKTNLAEQKNIGRHSLFVRFL